jgi:hypothetical protein
MGQNTDKGAVQSLAAKILTDGEMSPESLRSEGIGSPGEVRVSPAWVSHV